jgi:hypothetical protein
VVFSNVSMAGVPDLDPTIEAVAQSLPLRLSTAMLVSARFPYISPEGLAGRNGEYRFVDGGYFDNSGAATLLDIETAIRKAAERLGAADRVQIATLVIANEPIVAVDCAGPKPGGLATPLEILDQLREARSGDFQQKLRDRLTDRERNLFLDSLRPKSGDAEFPLGWTLALTTVMDMYKDVPETAITIFGKLDRLID